MKIKKYKCIVLSFAMILLCLGCGANSTGDDPKIGVYGSIHPGDPDTTVTAAYFWVTNSPSIPYAVINNEEYEAYDYYSSFRINAWDIDVEPGGEVSIDVYFTSSNNLESVASVDIFYPGNFEILTLDDRWHDTMNLGEDYFLDWTSSENADYYSLGIQYDYNYRDSYAEWRVHYLRLDTVLTDSELNLSAAFLYPDIEEIYTFEGGDGRVNIYAVTGPMLAGEPGNVEGDGFGIVRGKTNEIWFNLEIVE